MNNINDRMEIIALLKAISEVSEKLAVKDAKYEGVSKMTKRMAQLEEKGLTEDTIITILHTEGYLDDEQFRLVYNFDK